MYIFACAGKSFRLGVGTHLPYSQFSSNTVFINVGQAYYPYNFHLDATVQANDVNT